ncbi:MAG: PepSY domain-containing protein [Pseudolabrys sp.]
MPYTQLPAAAVLLVALGLPAPAAEVARNSCLGKAEQRAAVSANQAISLAQAIKSLRAHGKRAEVVRARLCRRGDGLVYVLTLLARNGKVTRATIDAANGELINGR